MYIMAAGSCSCCPREGTSSMLKEIWVLLYSKTDWLDTMNPMPPMSAARLYTC